jgi:3-oxoadipate enol-lactonase
MLMPFDQFGIGNEKNLVLLHAFPLSRSMWKPNVDAIVAAGYGVIAPDLRGFGENTYVTEISRMEDLAADVARLLEELQIEKVCLAGLSMGGYVAFNFCRLFPEKVSALVLCDTNHVSEDSAKQKVRFELIGEIEKRGVRALVDKILPNLVSEETKRDDPELVEELRNEFLKCRPEAAAAALRGMAERADHTYLLERIEVPTLLIFGENDKITNLETASILHENIPNAGLEIVSDAGHYANLENPREFNLYLTEFLQNPEF